MSSTGLVYDGRFLRHKAPYDHPEHPGRLSAIWERFGEEGLSGRCIRVEAREASREELLAIHTEGHVAEIESTARHAFVQLDPDTYASRDSALVTEGLNLVLADACAAEVLATKAAEPAMALARTIAASPSDWTAYRSWEPLLAP